METTEIDLRPWKLISYSDNYLTNPFKKLSTIIIGDSGNFFYIEDEYEKILDVSKMPDYIKKDWIKYNKKDLKIEILNSEIKKIKDRIESDSLSEKEIYDLNEVSNLLFSLRRNIIINLI